MADVFVVAVLVAFLASSSNSLTHAKAEIARHFFAGYGLLSLVATQRLRAQVEPGANDVATEQGLADTRTPCQ